MLLAFIVALAFDTAATKAEINAQLDAASTAAMALPNAAPGSPTKEQILLQIDLAKQLVTSFVEKPPPPPPPPEDMTLPMGIPNFAANPTIESTQSGTWEDKNTWGGKTPPGPEDVVKINAGHSVTLCEENATVFALGIAGSLEQCVEMAAKDIIVYPSGSLTYNPGAVRVFRDFPINQQTDPEQWGNCLLVLGKLRVNGTPKTPWRRLASEVKAGMNTLTLDDVPVGWNAGDELVLPRSQYNLTSPSSFRPTTPERTTSRSKSERVKIASIVGNLVTLVGAANYDHPAAIDRDGNHPKFPHVVNLTRDIVFKPERSGQRAHCVSMGPADSQVSYCAFRELFGTSVEPIDNSVIDSYTGELTHFGTNQIGKYPLHWHHCYGPPPGTNEYQFVARGVVIDGGDSDHKFKEWLAVHQSYYGLIEDSVIYNSAGSSFITEDGPEHSTTWRNCGAVRVRSRKEMSLGTDDPNDVRGTDGDAFWFKGCSRQSLINCWAADATRAAFWPARFLLNATKWPTAPGQQPSQYVPVDRTMLAFKAVTDCESYANGFPYTTNHTDALVDPIKDFVNWNTDLGTNLYYLASSIDGWTDYGDPGYIRLGTPDGMYGLSFDRGGNHPSRSTIVKRLRVDNRRVGVRFRRGPTPAVHHELDGADLACEIGIWITDTFQINGYDAVIRNVRITGGKGLPLKSEIVNSRFFATAQPMPQPGWVSIFYPTRTRFENYQSDGNNFRLFLPEQASSYVIPAPSAAGNEWPAEYVGKTNQQVFDQFGAAVAGEIMPADAVSVPTIVGFKLRE